MSCKLPVNCGKESTDVLVYRRGERLACIVATTDPGSLDMCVPDDAVFDEGDAALQAAGDDLVWAAERIRDPHISKNCEIEDVDPQLAEMLFGVIQVSFLHPSAVFDRGTSMYRAPIVAPHVDRPGDPRCPGWHAVGLGVPPSFSDAMPPEDRMDRIRTRPAAIVSWSTPWRDDEDILRVPCPRSSKSSGLPGDDAMNSTIIVAGDIVHPRYDANRSHTFHVKHDGGHPTTSTPPAWWAFADRSTVTYLGTCGCCMMLQYPRCTCRGIDDLRTTVHPEGLILRDETTMGLVRSARYNGIVIPTVCGCPLADRVRFERAMIPYTLMCNRPMVLEFRDCAGTTIELFEDGESKGVVDVVAKTRRGENIWLMLVNK
jgi:hypothetical protein